MRKALITGITGQDGSYLAEILLDKNYEVHGMMRRKAQVGYGNSKHIPDKIIFHYGNLIDSFSIMNIVREVRPDEIYNLAAQSFVGTAWQTRVRGDILLKGQKAVQKIDLPVSPEFDLNEILGSGHRCAESTINSTSGSG